MTEVNPVIGSKAISPVALADRTAGQAVGATALAASTSAVLACAACCVLPLALPAVMLASAGGMLAWLASGHMLITISAGIAVAAAWLWVWGQTRRVRAKPARGTIHMLALSTGLFGLALLWPIIEPVLIKTLQ
jgi:hypothetical protein